MEVSLMINLYLIQWILISVILVDTFTNTCQTVEKIISTGSHKKYIHPNAHEQTKIKKNEKAKPKKIFCIW